MMMNQKKERKEKTSLLGHFTESSCDGVAQIPKQTERIFLTFGRTSTAILLNSRALLLKSQIGSTNVALKSITESRYQV